MASNQEGKDNDTDLVRQVKKCSINSKWIKLNVGGKIFLSTKDTFDKVPSSMLSRMFSQDGLMASNVDEQGAYLIDRSSEYFAPILEYLRTGRLIYDGNLNPEGILEEAKFFGIIEIIPHLEDIIKMANSKRIVDTPLTREIVINCLIQTSHINELRFQGVNLSGADLRKLDFRKCNFKYANLHKCNLALCNLSGCNLERADLSYANLESAQLVAVKALCANMEGANLTGCNFEDPTGNKSNLEGCNLKSAQLEGSDMAGVNLRVANLKYANMKNCNLRGAVLAGADLESCNLSGSDLQEANLRGANLKDADLELLQTPIHMSQTIR